MPSVSASLLLLALPFFGLVFFAIWRGCGVDAKFFGIQFKAEPKLGPKRRRRKKPRQPTAKPTPEEPG